MSKSLRPERQLRSMRHIPPSFLNAGRMLALPSSLHGETFTSQGSASMPLSLRASSLDVNAAKGKLRLDNFICAHLDHVSRAKVQSAVKSGLVTINGAMQRMNSDYICHKATEPSTETLARGCQG